MVLIIKQFSKFYNQPPELLGEQDIINYLHYYIIALMRKNYAEEV